MKANKIKYLGFSRVSPVQINDVDALGRKLDSVREIRMTLHAGTWADNYWSQVESQLVRKIKRLMQRL
jgi:hypothetical protein